jgi:hypothetical protein
MSATLVISNALTSPEATCDRHLLTPNASFGSLGVGCASGVSSLAPAVLHLSSPSPVIEVELTSNSRNVELYCDDAYVETLRASPTDVPNRFKLSQTFAQPSCNLKFKCLSIKPKGETHLRVSNLDIKADATVPVSPPSGMGMPPTGDHGGAAEVSNMVNMLQSMGINPMDMMVRFTKLESEVKQLRSSNTELAKKINLVGGVLTKANSTLSAKVETLTEANAALANKVDALALQLQGNAAVKVAVVTEETSAVAATAETSAAGDSKQGNATMAAVIE